MFAQHMRCCCPTKNCGQPYYNSPYFKVSQSVSRDAHFERRRNILFKPEVLLKHTDVVMNIVIQHHSTKHTLINQHSAVQTSLRDNFQSMWKDALESKRFRISKNNNGIHEM